MAFAHFRSRSMRAEVQICAVRDVSA
jgi:hypothetical protein